MIEKIPIYSIFTALFFLLFLLLADLAEGNKERIQAFLEKIHWNTLIKTYFVWTALLFSRKLTYYIPFTGVIQTKDALFLVDKIYLVIIFFSVTLIVSAPVFVIKKKTPAARQFYLWWVLGFVFIVLPAVDNMEGEIEFQQTLLLVLVKAPLLFFKMLSSGKYIGLLTGLAAACYMVNRYNKIKTKKSKPKVKSFIVPGFIFVSILLVSFFRFTGNFEEKVIHPIGETKSSRAFEDLLDAADTIKDELDQSFALKEISAAIAGTGDIQWALDAAQRIGEENKRDRFHALKEVAAAALKVKNIKNVEYIFTQSLDVAAALGNTSKLEAAKEMVFTLLETRDRRWFPEIFQRLFYILEAVPGGNKKAVFLKEIIAAGSKASNKPAVREIIKHSVNMVNTLESGSRRFHLLRQLAAAVSNREWQEEFYPRLITAARTLEDKDNQVVLIMEIAVSAAKTGNLKWAKDIFQQALGAAHTIVNEKDRLLGVIKIASNIALAGDKKWAGEILGQTLAAAGKLDNNSVRCEVLKEIAAATARTGDIKQFGKRFQQAIDSAEKIGGNWLKSLTFKDIAAAAAETGDIPRAKTILKRAVDTANSIHHNNRYKPGTLKEIAAVVMTLGEIKWSGEILKQALHAAVLIEFNSIDDKLQYESGTLPGIAALVVDTGDLKWAKEIFLQAIAAAGKIASPFRQPNALKQIGLGVLNLKRRKGVSALQEDILRQVMVTADKIKDDKVRFDLLTTVAAGIAKTGDTKWTAETFNQLIDKVEAIKPIFFKPYAFIAVAEAAARTGNTGWSKKIFKRILSEVETLNPWDQTRFLKDAAAAVAKSGNIRWALSIAGSIEEEMVRKDALEEIHRIENE